MSIGCAENRETDTLLHVSRNFPELTVRFSLSRKISYVRCMHVTSEQYYENIRRYYVMLAMGDVAMVLFDI